MPPTGAAPPTDALDEEVLALYRGPLGDFTAGKTALAKRLQKAGHPRAAEIKAMTKPTPSAWAVNRLFADEPAAMSALFARGAAAHAGVAAAMASGQGAAVREALAFVRAETARLTELGLALLAAAQGDPSPALAERVRVDLDALALDPAHAALAARRFLDGDLAAPGFEILAALQLAADQGAPAATSGARTASATPGAARGGPAHASGTRPVAVQATARPGAGTASTAGARAETSPARTPPKLDAAARRAAAEREQRLAAAGADLARAEEQEAALRTAAEAASTAAAAATRAANEAVEHAEQARRSAADAKRRAEQARFELLRAREAYRRAGGA